jgi:hypothetical protein
VIADSMLRRLRRWPRRSAEMAFSEMQKVPSKPLAKPSQESEHYEKPRTQIGTAANVAQSRDAGAMS